MKKRLSLLLLFPILFFAHKSVVGQSAPYCPSINAQFGTGPSTTICQGNCATLASSVVPVNQTTTYSVGSTPYAPFSFTSGTSILANQDDIWSPVLNLGFPFCYFGNTYTQCIVGSNGQLSFNLATASGSDNWSISAALPNTTNMPGNTICAAFRDIDPTSSGNIYYAYYGTAPCRSMVISWNNIPLFSGSCYPSDPASTFQLVLHETTNYIDVFIQNSTSCSAWNGGYGIIGIQNAAASIGVSPAGRNYPSTWTAVNEGWRFVPTGPQSYTVNWNGPSGLVGTGLNVAVCPSVTTSYTANMVVSPCSSSSTTFSSVVQVSVVPGPTLVTNSPTICGGGSATLTVSGATSYTWLPSNSTATSIVVSPSSTTTYTVIGKTGTSCSVTKTVQVTVSPTPTVTPGSNSPICAGSTLSLTTNAASSYTWTGPNSFSSNLQNPTIPSASTLAAGQYTVNVTSVGGCTATAVINVVVNNAPGVTASNSGPICPNQTLSFTSVGSGPYSWTGPNAFSSTLQNPTIPSASTLAAGVYTVVAGVGTCTALATTTVVINALPTPTASNTGPYCSGATIQLNVGAFSTYTWSGPAFSSNSQNPTIPNSTTAMSGTYTVTVTSASGCTASATTSVTVNPLPVPVVGSNSPLCAGQTLSLTSSGGNTYSWSGPNSFSSTSQNPTIPSVTSANAGVYTVTVTSAAGCVKTGTISITVNTPTSTAANTGPYCAGQTISLSTPAATSYTWSGPSAFSSNAQNPTIPNSTTVMSGVYTVTSTTGGCSSTATTNVIVNALPAPVAGNTGPYCPGATIQLNVGAFTTYTWSGPSAFSSNLQNPTQANAQATNGGVYTVTVTNAQGCVNTATTNVVINPLPVPVVGSNSPLCAGTTLSLTASGGNTYAWSGPNSFSSVLQNPTVPFVTSANAGVYTVTVTSAAGCVKTGTVNVTVNTPTSTAANTGPYCVGQTISLSTPAATSFTWSGPSFSSNAQNPTIPNSTTAMSGVYTVTANTGGCTSTATTNVVVNALPVPTAGNTGPYCPGNTIQLNVGAFTTYTWSGPSSFSSNSQNPTQANAQTTNGGVYTVSVTNAQGCVNTATTNVVVNPTPVVNIGSNSPVCLNTNINLTSNGGTSYSWSGPNSFSSTLQNPTVVNATLADAGVYTVTVTALGCTNTGTVNVIVTTPTTSASNSGPYCAGSTISLSAPPATSYTWSGPGGYSSNSQNATQANATPAMSGTYSVIVSIGTCTANATTNVVVNALPNPTAQNNSPVCAGQTINFTGLGGTTYTWSGPSYNSTQQNPVITNANSSNAGTYILTVTDANGCTNVATTNVVVNPLPVIAVNNPTNCVNTTINLTSNGGTSYSWSGPNSFSSTVQNPNIPSAQLNMSGVYVVTVTDVNGCINTASANVSVLPLPNPNIAGNSPVCVGGTLNLQGSGGAVYAWSGPGYTGSNQNPTINNVNASAAGIYTLLVSSGSCTASTTYTVVINPLPVLNFTNNNVLCNGQSNGSSNVNVTVGTSPYNYVWSTSPVQTTSTANNLTAGTYTCFVTDANGCSNIASTQITQPTVFTITANSSVSSACAGVPINANANGNGGTAPYNFNWVGGPASSSYAINETVSGNYIYTVNATDANGCVAVANLNLTFFPQPTVTATSATLCAGQSTVLTAQGANSYTWQPGNVTGSTYPFNGNTTTNITVTGSANGCNNTYNTAIMVNPNPNGGINISSNKGCVPACIDFNSNGSQNVVSYNWILNGAGITGSVNGSYCFSEAASYTIGLTVMDAFGCTGTANPVVVDIYPQPTADFNYSPIKPIVNIDQDVIFTDASYGTTITNWNWYFMNTAQYTSVLQNPTFAYTEPGTYAVALVVKSDKGCTDTLVKQIVVGEDFGIYVPNAFTPNGDGLNDFFQPKGFGVTKYEINIFDRWGERVFHTNAFDEGWDGTIKGRTNKPVEDGVYTWLIDCTDVFGKSHELKGHVTLMK